jgi:DNA-binding MarR family transcriptional regulator
MTLRNGGGTSLIFEQIARSIYENRPADALHPAQWSALRFFAKANRSARTATGLARYLGITVAPASRTAATLVSRGFAVCEKSADDARSRIFTLTAEGQKILRSDPIHRLTRAIKRLDPKDGEQFDDLLEQVYDNLNKQNEAARNA